MDAVRRLASLAVCVCLFTAMPAVGAYADDADFVVKNGVLTEYNGNDSSVKIPESVFEIADGVFADNGSITAVDLSDRVVYVGDNAFYGCENLKTVSGTKNVKKLGARAFEKTAWFDSLTDDVKMLNNVVIGCKANVKKIVIPENALSVAPMAFYGNTAVEQLKLPDGLQEIGSFAFYDCKSLGTLEYGNNSTGMNMSYIGTEAFKNTKWYDLNDGDFLSINGIICP